MVVGQKSNVSEYERLLKVYDFPATVVCQEDLALGQAGGVAAGLTVTDDEEPVFILGGNDYVHPQIYGDILALGNECDGGVLAKRVNSYFPGGYLQIDEDHRILSIVEKPPRGEEPSDLVNIIAHYFRSAKPLKEALLHANSKEDDLYEVALGNLFQTHHIKAVEYGDYWQAVKFPWHVLDMGQLLMTHQTSFTHPTVQLAEGVVIKGENVYLDEGVKIFENAVIQGPCYVGKNTVIGNNCLVRQSMIGENCTIGFSTEVARSYLANNISTHFAYIGDSVVDGGCNFGAFSCTANLRHDHRSVGVMIKEEKVDSGCGKLGGILGQNVQIGIHACLMPGAKVPSESWVMPGEVIK